MVLEAFSLDWLNLNDRVDELKSDVYLGLKLLQLVLNREVDKPQSETYFRRLLQLIGSVSMTELMSLKVKYI